MNLVLDIGNTRSKMALFHSGKDGKMQKHDVVDGFDLQAITNFCDQAAVDHCLIANSADIDKNDLDELQQRYNAVVLNSDMDTALGNKYESVATLGMDRLAVANGGRHLYPENDLLVITTGTCITYNMVEKRGNFVGGGISPGLIMRYEALHHFTDKLPLIEDEEFDNVLGMNTKESILSGVRQGIVSEIDGIIDEYRNIYQDLIVLITGGDSTFFESRLKNRIFALPFLTLVGLNSIIEHNISKQIGH